MSHPALTQSILTEKAVQMAPRIGLLLALSFCTLGAALLIPDSKLGLAVLAMGTTLLSVSALIFHLARRDRAAQTDLCSTVAGFVENDASPSFTTDGDGQIRYRNNAALDRFEDAGKDALLSVLGNIFASPGATLFRLQQKAMKSGAAREDVVMRRGHMRLAVHRIGRDGFLWRLEDVLERAQNGRNAEGISLPMLTVSKSNTVLFMNDAMRRLVGGRRARMDRVFNDLPLVSGRIHEIAGTDGPVRAQVSIVTGATGRQEIFLLPASEAADTAPLHKGSDNSNDPIQALPVPLIRIDPDGKILRCNRLARELLDSEEPDGLYLGDLLEGLGRSIPEWVADAISHPQERCSEFLRVSKHSNEVYLQITLTPVTEGDRTTLVAVLNDATKLKTLEAQFVQSQKMQAIGQLAGGVAHDFNNLLTAISGHCDLLLLGHDEGDPEYADLMQISQNANRAASLVGQLLAFSRKQTLQPVVIDVRDAMDDLAHLLNRLVGETVSLSLDHDPELPAIRADKRQLEQVIMNLVVNARDAMPNGGEIRIKTQAETLQEPYERDRARVPPGNYVVVTVGDQGCGIPADKLTKIFEPFYTTKRTGEGTGLGLSMAYGIVKQTGGYIFVDSQPTKGTTFTLFFPAHVGDAEQAPKVSVERAKSTSITTGGVVLLVEDEAPVRAFASRALKMRGYTVLEAGNAEEALETLRDENLKIDVFVTDVIMPGMDGPSWVAKALEDRPGVSVVFVSGYAEESFSEQQARIPNSVFLPKPFSLSELTATVHDQIH